VPQAISVIVTHRTDDMARLPPVAGGGAAPVRAGAAGPARPRLALPGAPPRGSHAPQPDQASGAAADAPAAPPQAAAAPAAARSGCDGAGAGAPGADDCGAACHGSAVIADGPSCAGATHELCPAAHPCSLSHGLGPWVRKRHPGTCCAVVLLRRRPAQGAKLLKVPQMWWR